MKNEQIQAGHAVETKATVADASAVSPVLRAWQETLLKLRERAFDLLRTEGYDRVEVEYESKRGDAYLPLSMTFYRVDEAVADGTVCDGVREAVWAFVYGCIPAAPEYTRFLDGSARIYTASEYICFRQYTETANYFWDGKPGEEVPEEDIYPTPDEEELLESHDEDFDDDVGQGDFDDEM